jgi:hypothetical protein
MNLHEIVITVSMLLSVPAPIFAMRGRGGDCVESCAAGVCGSSSGCGNSSDGDRGGDNRVNSGNNSGSNGSSSSAATQSNQNRPYEAIYKDELAAECYIAPNGQICTKAQLIAASKELAEITTGLVAGDTNIIVSSVTQDIVLRLFGIDIAPLGCAIATQAPAELCQTAARIQELDAEAKAIEKAMNDRIAARIKELIRLGAL